MLFNAEASEKPPYPWNPALLLPNLILKVLSYLFSIDLGDVCSTVCHMLEVSCNQNRLNVMSNVVFQLYLYMITRAAATAAAAPQCPSCRLDMVYVYGLSNL